MQIVIPMRGKGVRFAQAGYSAIKPLIEVHGRPMIEYVANLFPGEEDFLFLSASEHIAETNLAAVLKKLKPSGKVLSLPFDALGAVSAILLAGDAVKDNEPIVVNYCDFNMHWDYADFKKRIEETGTGSAAVCYRGFHPHLLGPNLYAGVRVDDRMMALEVREKHSFTPNKMDTWQQAGTFYFKSGALLKKYCEEVVAQKIMVHGEHYVSLLYNLLIADGLTSLVYPAQYFCQWGTPEDLQEYEAWAHFVVGHLREDGKAGNIPSSYPPEVKKWRAYSDADLAHTFRYWREYFLATGVPKEV